MLQHDNICRKGQASMISLALYSAVVVIGISTVVLVGTPILENMQDVDAIEAAKDMLTGLEGQIRGVADAGEGSQTAVGLRFARGEFIFDADRDSITYELETDAEIMSPHTSRKIGNLQLSSLAGVTVEESAVDGQPCWKLENEHISTCIRKIPENTTEQIQTDTIGYWRFNENAGSTAHDDSNYGNDGTINGARWRTGIQDNGLDFDGTDDYVNLTGFDFSADGFAIAAWVYPREATETQAVFSNRDNGGILRTYWFQHGGTDFRFSNGTHWQSVSGRQADENEWLHLTGVYNGTHNQLYLNGQLENTTQATGDPVANNYAYIGQKWNDAEWFNGTIDEVRIWNRSLSQEEINWLYKQHGMLDYMDTEDLVLRYYNKDKDRELNASFGVTLQTDKDIGFTNNGTGYVQPQLTGDGLGRGRVNANVKSFFGIDYTVAFKLLSGSDFLQVDVEE